MSTSVGFKQSPESIRKRVESRNGYRHSPETRKEISDSNIGRIGSFKGKTLSDAHKKNISDSHFGIKHSPETKEKLRIKNIGRKLSPETIEKMRNSHKNAPNNGWFKKGSTPANKGKRTKYVREKINPRKVIEESYKYSEWRSTIFIRDNFTCQKCSKKGGILNVHHIKSFMSLYKEAQDCMPLLNVFDAVMMYTPIWDINNGITFCEKCHLDFHKIYGKNNNNKKQVVEFIRNKTI